MRLPIEMIVNKSADRVGKVQSDEDVGGGMQHNAKCARTLQQQHHGLKCNRCNKGGFTGWCARASSKYTQWHDLSDECTSAAVAACASALTCQQHKHTHTQTNPFSKT